jgi:hypothetical protein
MGTAVDRAGAGVLRTLARRGGRPEAPSERRERMRLPEPAEPPDPVDLASELSFPASDPPAWIYMNS